MDDYLNGLSIKEIRGMVKSNAFLDGVKLTGKGRTKKAIISDIKQILQTQLSISPPILPFISDLPDSTSSAVNHTDAVIHTDIKSKLPIFKWIPRKWKIIIVFLILYTTLQILIGILYFIQASPRQLKVVTNEWNSHSIIDIALLLVTLAAFLNACLDKFNFISLDHIQ